MTNDYKIILSGILILILAIGTDDNTIFNWQTKLIVAVGLIIFGITRKFYKKNE